MPSMNNLVEQHGHTGDSGVCPPTDFKDLKMFNSVYIMIRVFLGAASAEQGFVVFPGYPCPQQQPGPQCWRMLRGPSRLFFP